MIKKFNISKLGEYAMQDKHNSMIILFKQMQTYLHCLEIIKVKVQPQIYKIYTNEKSEKHLFYRLNLPDSFQFPKQMISLRFEKKNTNSPGFLFSKKKKTKLACNSKQAKTCKIDELKPHAPLKSFLMVHLTFCTSLNEIILKLKY